MRSAGLLALVAFVIEVSAVYKGFNYGATKSDGYAPRVQSDFQSLFSTAKNLVGTTGFTSARLYTTIQAGTASDPTSAIPAAIAEDISILLTLWASGTAFPQELLALKTAIAQYGTAFTNRVAGIAIGSEDLYRNSPTGIAAGSTIGADPATIVEYIQQVRSAIAGGPLAAAPVGHVDTWTAWVNGSNQAVIDNSDWIGVDAYPYFQNTQSNGIENGAALFNEAVDNTVAAVGGKPVWITETGWPISGKTENLAVANTQNAETYWKQVGCPRFDVVNTWWYTLEDTDNSASPNPSFGVAPGNPLSSTPLFDLSCDGASSSSSTKPSSTVAGSASGAAAASATGSSGWGALASASSALAGGGIVSTGGNLSPSKPAVDGSAGAGSAAATGSSSGSSGVSVGSGSVSSGSGSSSGNSTLLTTATPSGTDSPGGSATSPAVEIGNSAASKTVNFVILAVSLVVVAALL
ncbi:putative glucan endo-1,3-beta-glucosidase eglC [Diplocarpon rosae]|nr:putative glucan endo-1,3-beta-glucosidase eglC [Diplocarpon rosae]